eukprot:s117_g18.t1
MEGALSSLGMSCLTLRGSVFERRRAIRQFHAPGQENQILLLSLERSPAILGTIRQRFWRTPAYRAMAARPSKCVINQRCRPEVMSLLKEFYLEILTPNYIHERRKELRENHGLSRRDPRVCKFSLVDIKSGQVGEHEARSDTDSEAESDDPDPSDEKDRKPLTANLADQDAELERRAEALCLELGKEKMNSDVLKANGPWERAWEGEGRGKGRGKGSVQSFKPDVETQTGRSASPPKGPEEPQLAPETCRPKKASKNEPKTEPENKEVKQPKAVPKAEKPELPDHSPEVQNFMRLVNVANSCEHLEAALPSLPLQKKLTTAGFYVYNASKHTLKQIEQYHGVKLTINKKTPPGCSIYWNTHHGPHKSWSLAKLMARWEHVGADPWALGSGDECDDISDDEDFKNVD